MHSFIFILYIGYFISIFVIKSRDSLETNDQSSSSNIKFYFSIDLKISTSELPLKGG